MDKGRKRKKKNDLNRNCQGMTFKDRRKKDRSKVGCVFLIANWAVFRMWLYKDEDHQEEGSYFRDLLATDQWFLVAN